MILRVAVPFICLLLLISLSAIAADKQMTTDEQSADLPKLNYVYVAEDSHQTCHLNYIKDPSVPTSVVTEKCTQKDDFIPNIWRIKNVGNIYNVITIRCAESKFAYIAGEAYDVKGKFIQTLDYNMFKFMQIKPGTSIYKYRRIACGLD